MRPDISNGGPDWGPRACVWLPRVHKVLFNDSSPNKWHFVAFLVGWFKLCWGGWEWAVWFRSCQVIATSHHFFIAYSVNQTYCWSSERILSTSCLHSFALFEFFSSILWPFKFLFLSFLHLTEGQTRIEIWMRYLNCRLALKCCVFIRRWHLWFLVFSLQSLRKYLSLLTFGPRKQFLLMCKLKDWLCRVFFSLYQFKHAP